MTDSVSNQEHEALLALGHLPQIGPTRGRRLIHLCGSAQQAIAAPTAVWEEALGGAVVQRLQRHVHQPHSIRWSQEELRRLGDLGGELIGWGDADYPAWLAQIDDPPLALYALGNRQLLQPPAVAIVGSRRCSSYGRRASVSLAGDLAGRGVTIVSGLARGIDGAAHEGALRVGGATIGVLGCGVDVTYPREHRRLQRQVQRDGLLLAEAPLGTPPEGRGFPKRNRIVSGLALAVIVVEAPQRSGALMTARLAREQGRDVFAVPGEITNPRCAGCLALLRDGAGLVRTAQDVIDELEVHLPKASIAVAGAPLSQGDDLFGPAGSEATLLDALTSGEHGIEALARQVGQSIDVVQQALLRLELSGQVVRLPGQRYARAS